MIAPPPVLSKPGPPVMTVRRLPSACRALPIVVRVGAGAARPIAFSESLDAGRIASVTGVFYCGEGGNRGGQPLLPEKALSSRAFRPLTSQTRGGRSLD